MIFKTLGLQGPMGRPGLDGIPGMLKIFLSL
jgi:hypothetical protein